MADAFRDTRFMACNYLRYTRACVVSKTHRGSSLYDTGKVALFCRTHQRVRLTLKAPYNFSRVHAMVVTPLSAAYCVERGGSMSPKCGRWLLHLYSCNIYFVPSTHNRILVLHVPKCCSIRDGNGRTALHFAATGGSVEVVGAILDMAPAVIDSKVPSCIVGASFCSGRLSRSQ